MYMYECFFFLSYSLVSASTALRIRRLMAAANRIHMGASRRGGLASSSPVARRSHSSRCRHVYRRPIYDELRGSRVGVTSASASTSASTPPEAEQFSHEVGRFPLKLKLFSPSKINVFLRVTARRDDGFHDLASLFQVIDYGDDIEVAVNHQFDHREANGSLYGDTLYSPQRSVPLDRRNLIIRAFEEFRKRTGRHERFVAHVRKRVHTGAGLGGGSANASTALFAANRLCGNVATEAELLKWSANVGSDCPVFFSHGAAYCTGKGEVVNDLVPPPISGKLLLVKPSDGLATSSIFKSLRLDERSDADPAELLNGLTKEGKCVQDLCVNDLEPPAFAQMPGLANLKDALRSTCTHHHELCYLMFVRNFRSGCECTARCGRN